MDPIQTMPNNEAMAGKVFTAKEWLTYYLNVWYRNVVARTIDVESDRRMKAEDPTATVQNPETGMPMPIGERLEHRKIAVSDAWKLVQSIQAMLAEATNDEQFNANRLSDEALKVDEDMMPKEPVVGDACELPNGTQGTWQDLDGQLVCAVTPDEEDTAAVAPAEEAAPAAEAEAAPAEAETAVAEPAAEAPAADADAAV
jgi:hypothetical protein